MIHIDIPTFAQQWASLGPLVPHTPMEVEHNHASPIGTRATGSSTGQPDDIDGARSVARRQVTHTPRLRHLLDMTMCVCW